MRRERLRAVRFATPGEAEDAAYVLRAAAEIARRDTSRMLLRLAERVTKEGTVSRVQFDALRGRVAPVGAAAEKDAISAGVLVLGGNVQLAAYVVVLGRRTAGRSEDARLYDLSYPDLPAYLRERMIRHDAEERAARATEVPS